MLIDTHCHIHDQEFFSPQAAEEVYRAARQAGVEALFLVGTDQKSSQQAIEFARDHEGAYAIIGVHPHETSGGIDEFLLWARQRLNDPHTAPLIIGIGEIGLDYFYQHAQPADQQKALAQQLQLAQDYQLPVSFHVREAFSDFWPIFDKAHNARPVRGVLHSFTDTMQQAEAGLSRGLYIGVNGISTFTKDAQQQAMFDALPLDRIVLETDAPFLAPVGHRGKQNQPAWVKDVAAYHAARRACDVQKIADTTTSNAQSLFLS
jgi:hydrolase, tatD family